MTSDQIQGLIRHVLTAGAGILVTLGYVDDSTGTAAVGVAMQVVGMVWSFVSKIQGA